ncbi:MAG: hypothetical protein JXR75_07490 [Rhodobacteraceae bacterium]|nr:hypothetical protein [Paracoccaceae bacterium]
MLLVIAVATGPGVLADLIGVTIAADSPEGTADRPVSWSATPLDLPPEADVFAAMTKTPEPVTGPWQVALEPGRYLISGFSEVELYELEVTLPDAGATILVPQLPVAPAVVFRCTEAPTCDYTHPESGLSLTLPQGWALDAPYHGDLGDGEVAPDLSAVIYEDRQDDGAAVWFLNPPDWITDDNGPCRGVAIGQVCTFEISDAADGAFATIAPSLRIAPPDRR